MQDALPHLSQRLQPHIRSGYDTITVEVVLKEGFAERAVRCSAGAKSCPIEELPEPLGQDIVNFCHDFRNQFARFGGSISAVGLGVSRTGKSVAWAISEDR